MRWLSDGNPNGHRGYLNLSWLRENSYSASARTERKNRTRPIVAVSSTLYLGMITLLVIRNSCMHTPLRTLQPADNTDTELNILLGTLS